MLILETEDSFSGSSDLHSRRSMMQYQYSFVNLDDEQTARRRHLLDWYGQLAQLSILLLPLVYYLSRGIRLIATRIGAPKSDRFRKDRQSPVVSRFDEGSRGSLWGRVRWTLDDEILQGWGTSKECGIAVLWAIWMLMLAVRETGNGEWGFSSCSDVLNRSESGNYRLILSSGACEP